MSESPAGRARDAGLSRLAACDGWQACVGTLMESRQNSLADDPFHMSNESIDCGTANRSSAAGADDTESHGSSGDGELRVVCREHHAVIVCANQKRR